MLYLLLSKALPVPRNVVTSLRPTCTSLSGSSYIAHCPCHFALAKAPSDPFVSDHRTPCYAPCGPQRTSAISLSSHQCMISLHIVRQKVASHTKHLSADNGGKAVHLSSVLLDLSTHQQCLQSRWLSRQLEQSLVLVFGQQRLLACSARSVLGLPLCLPCCDLCLLTRKRTLVVLCVVQLGVVVFYALEQQIRGLLQKGVNTEIQALQVRCERVGGDLRVSVECGERAWEVQCGLAGRLRGELVKEASQEMRVVDD